MAYPGFTPNPEDVKMGPAIVIFDGQPLGYTMNDSLNINYTQNTTPIQPDQASIPISDRVTSVEATVDVTFAKVDKSILKLLPGGSESGLQDPGGIDLRYTGKTLKIYPLDSTDTRVFVFPKATPVMNGGINFARETPSGTPIQFKVYLESAGAYIIKFTE